MEMDGGAQLHQTNHLKLKNESVAVIENFFSSLVYLVEDGLTVQVIPCWTANKIYNLQSKTKPTVKKNTQSAPIINCHKQKLRNST
jgi:hypothetical protein